MARIQRAMAALTLQILFPLALLAPCYGLATRQSTDLVVTQPESGYTFSLAPPGSEGYFLDIAWTVPDAIADRPVVINLVSGNNLSALETVWLVESDAPNNGSHHWYADGYDSGLLAGFSYSLPSACNYSIELKIWTDVVYSGYFTMINAQDGGLDREAVCPDPGSQLRPAVASFESTKSSDETGGADGEGTGGSGSASAGGGDSSGAGSSGQKSEGGLPTRLVVVAAVVPVVVLLLLFGLLIWLGLRKGWFARNREDKATSEERSSAEKLGTAESYRNGGSDQHSHPKGPAELHDRYMPYHIEGSQVLELEGNRTDGHGGRRDGV